jgi:predicted ATP-grasp superfamily ATP-dependent carboligase
VKTPQIIAKSLNDHKQPSVLLAATLWWPLAARLAMRFIGYGCEVKAICPRGHLLRHVSGMGSIYRYHRLRSLASLEYAIRAANPDLIVPCDDRVVWQLHDLYAKQPDLRPLIETSLGPASEYGIVSQREQLLRTADELGIRIPRTVQVQSEEEIHSWFAGEFPPAVLKLDGSGGGEGVEIAHSEEEAIEIFRKMSDRPGFGTALKRLLVNQDPVSIWESQRQNVPVITIQQFIHGRPANAMLACWRGELLSMVSVEVIRSLGETRAALVVRVIENQEIERAAQLLSRRLQLTGFYGLDFMLDPETHRTWLIEMNPRCTQLGHLPLTKNGDLAGALCQKLVGRKCIANEARIEKDVIAFFPQAVLSDPSNPLLRSGYHDVPWEQPQLVRELLMEIWPNRQWIARLYHHFRPPQDDVPVEFEANEETDVLASSSDRGRL